MIEDDTEIDYSDDDDDYKPPMTPPPIPPRISRRERTIHRWKKEIEYIQEIITSLEEENDEEYETEYLSHFDTLTKIDESKWICTCGRIFYDCNLNVRQYDNHTILYH